MMQEHDSVMSEAFALIIFIWTVFGTREISGKDILMMDRDFTLYEPVYLKKIVSV